MELSGNGLIYVGVPRERFYMPAFVDNRDNILGRLNEIGRACGLFQAEGHRVDRNRDRIVERFLASPREPEWLLMLDSDQEYPVTIGERLVRWNKPIVSCLYFHRGEIHDPLAFKYQGLEPDKYGRMIDYYAPIRDEVYDFLANNRVPMRDGGLSIDDAIGDPLIEVDAAGTGGMLIHRSVLEMMIPPWFEYQNGWGSEDLEFCKWAKEQGIPIYVDMSTIAGHYALTPMGHAQFRQVYEDRGMGRTYYTFENAVSWLTDFLGGTKEANAQALEEYHPSLLAEHWANSDVRTVNDLRHWYEDEETGRLYLLDLLSWNQSDSFNKIRSQLKGWRGKEVIELGGGIGTVAMQLAIQRNNVTMVEPNRLLAEFCKFRWERVQESISGLVGDLNVVPNLQGEGYDLAVAIDVFEHMHETYAGKTLEDMGERMKTGGRLFVHNNFRQQDLYPMHYDHSALWEKWLEDAGFFQLDSMWSLKVKHV